MEELKKFELNNSILEKFDDVMTYHLDHVEELTIKEAFSNPKLYNIISLCINLKSLIIEGDLRVDVNKIINNVCKPELLETLILSSVKLPTTKNISRFTNIQTISLNNVTFSNVCGFFERIQNKEKVEAINLSGCDLGKKSISILKIFPNLKLLNLDSLINCKLDDFSFLSENENMERLDFFGNEVTFDILRDLSKRKYTKNIDLKIKTSSDSHIDNRFEITGENEISLTINLSDLEEVTKYLPLVKVTNLYLIIDNDTPINRVIKMVKKVKGKVKIVLKEMYYLDVQGTQDLSERLGANVIGVLDYDNRKVKNYPIHEYIRIREKFDKLISEVPEESSEKEKFEQIYNKIKENVSYDESEDCDIKTFFLENRANYNLYANILKSLLMTLNIKVNTVKGFSYNDNSKLHVWNQVKLDGRWYNVDLGGDVKYNGKKHAKSSLKNILQDDEAFLKNHIPQSGEPVECVTKIDGKKKNIKDVKKIGPFKRFFYKIKNAFNKNKALPEPEDSDD